MEASQSMPRKATSFKPVRPLKQLIATVARPVNLAIYCLSSKTFSSLTTTHLSGTSR